MLCVWLLFASLCRLLFFSFFFGCCIRFELESMNVKRQQLCTGELSEILALGEMLLAVAADVVIPAVSERRHHAAADLYVVL